MGKGGREEGTEIGREEEGGTEGTAGGEGECKTE